MSNLLPKWLVSTATILWIGLILAGELVSVGPERFGVEAPNVELAMQGCTSEDMHQRYECKEQLILANQRHMFVKAVGFVFVLIGPPIALWVLANRLRKLDPRSLRPDRRPPSIAKWRVR
jgi:hypothetical protein